MSHIAAEGKCHRGADLQHILLVVSQIHGLDNNYGIPPTGGGMHMNSTTHHLGDIHGALHHLVSITGKGNMLWADTGLPFVKPSPNLPSPEAVTVYNGTCMLAGTNVSEGRGTTTPFTTVGAPFVQPEALSDAMNSLHLPGLAFSPAFFTPFFGKYTGQVCRGVDIHVTNPRAVRAVSLGLYLLDALHTLCPGDFAFTPPPAGARWHIDLSTGNQDVREGKLTIPQILEKWQPDADTFRAGTVSCRLYD